MLTWEIRKLCTRFTVFALLILFCLNAASVLLLYGKNSSERGQAIRTARDELLEKYLNDHEVYEAELAAFREQEIAYEDWMRNGDGCFTCINEKIDLDGYGDASLWRDVRSEIERAENFHADLDRVLREAYARLRDIGERRGEFEYEYQVEVILHYESLSEFEITPQNIYGWNEFFSLVTPTVFLTLAVILVGTQVFLNEKQARFSGILHVARFGEIRTRLAKIGTLFLSSTVLTAVFTLTPLLILNFTTGLSESSQLMQALDDFEFCPVGLTIRDALWITLGVRAITVFALSLVAACVGSLTGSAVLTGGVMLVFLGISAVTEHGYFTAALVRFFLERFRAVNLFGTLVDSERFCAFLVCSVLVLGIAGAMLLKMNPCEFRLMDRIRKAIQMNAGIIRLPVRETVSSVQVQNRSLYRWELYKICGRPGMLVLLCGLFLLRLALQNAFFTPSVSRDDATYRAYIADLNDLGGRVDQTTDGYIAEEAVYLAQAAEAYTAATEQYRAGKITSVEYSAVSGRKNYAENVQGGFAKVLERQAYLKAMSTQYENLGYADDAGMKKLLRPDFDLVFAAAILLLFSDLFAGEWQSGFAVIQRTARCGRSSTFRAKLAASLTVSTVLWFVLTACDLIMLTVRFPLFGLSFGMKSIPGLASSDWNIPFWVCAIITKVTGLIGAMCLTVFAAGCSALSSHTTITSSILFVIMLAPYLTSKLGLNAFDTVSAKPLFSPILPDDIPRLVGWGLLSGIIILPAIVRWNGIKRR